MLAHSCHLLVSCCLWLHTYLSGPHFQGLFAIISQYPDTMTSTTRSPTEGLDAAQPQQMQGSSPPTSIPVHGG